MPVSTKDAAISGRLRIMSCTGQTGFIAVQRMIDQSRDRAEDGFPMTFEEAWDTVSSYVARNGDTGAKKLLQAVESLSEATAVGASTDSELADEALKHLMETHWAEEEKKHHKAAAARGWTWEQIAVIRSAMALGSNPITATKEVVSAAESLYQEKTISFYRVRNGELYAYITPTGELDWLRWITALRIGGYIQLGPE
ncbi:hypothetical protein [Streptomyces sp. NPDC056987]|uniref:hypothetical protein n=1 Tax=Streptomyces sp. NPDC056987 TaxID=3345988 RepID=UPI0036335205